MTITSIRVSTTTRDKLNNLKEDDESVNSVIRRLVEEHIENQGYAESERKGLIKTPIGDMTRGELIFRINHGHPNLKEEDYPDLDFNERYRWDFKLGTAVRNGKYE